MADVILGRAGSTVLIDLDVCVKTGRVTHDRVTLRGHTTPAWVTLLLLFTIVGFFIAGMMSSRRYRVTLPFSHEVHERWRNNRRLAWLVALIGVCALMATATVGDDDAGLFVGSGFAFMAGGVVLGTINAVKNNVGIRMTRDDDLVLTGAHPTFVQAVNTASREPLTR
ncbi:hypothetical protein [Nocardioides daeguensis]|uniref:SdpI family protein n=1 Tax=Nocardioides daeguensis TaxID=908359 RepID=A0ABP6VK38_9ACTN|nr:hypothetical protein [Nocardioides daeguensis]MBV6728866.1 hypothetical protein [Nocardioides daeguensis]MCR1773387.1 hypothetical protein [Nocardioides daeguensis]